MNEELLNQFINSLANLDEVAYDFLKERLDAVLEATRRIEQARNGAREIDFDLPLSSNLQFKSFSLDDLLTLLLSNSKIDKAPIDLLPYTPPKNPKEEIEFLPPAEVGKNPKEVIEILPEITGKVKEKEKEKEKEIKEKEKVVEKEPIQFEKIPALKEPPPNEPKDKDSNSEEDKGPRRDLDELMVSATAQPWEDIARSVKENFIKGSSYLQDIANQIGVSFEALAGGFKPYLAEGIQANEYPVIVEQFVRGLENYSEKINRLGTQFDEAIKSGFANQVARTTLKGVLPEEIYENITNALGRYQFAFLKEALIGEQGIGRYISLIEQDLGTLSRIALSSNSLNIGSPEFYKGFMNLPVETSVPVGTMGQIFAEFRNLLSDYVNVSARTLFKPQDFREYLDFLAKGLGVTFATSEPLTDLIEKIQEKAPDLYQRILPHLGELGKFTSLAEFSQQIADVRNALREIVALTGVERPITATDIESNPQLKGMLDELKVRVFSPRFIEALRKLSQLEDLDTDTRKAVDGLKKIIQTLGSIENTGQGTLDLTAFEKSLQVVGDNLEKNISEYFTKKFDVSTFKSIAEEARKREIISEEEYGRFQLFAGKTGELFDYIDRKLRGNLTIPERIGYFFSSQLTRPTAEFLEMNITNLQWALMLGLTSSIMDLMTRPAYETVYSAISPIFGTVSSLTGVGTLFRIFQAFPETVQETTALLQTSLNSISALLGSQFFAQKAVSTALELSRTQPIQFPEAIEVLTALATYPSTRPYAMQPGFQRKVFDVIQLLSLLAPEQGIEGALFALREALGGQWRSMQMRFNISPEVLAQYAGIPYSKLRGATGEELINYLATALTNMFGGERVLLQKGAQLDVQLENITDTLTQAIVLPFVSERNKKFDELVERWFSSGLIEQFMPSQYRMMEDLAKGDRKEMLRIAQETWGTPVGLISGMLSMFNNALGNLMGGLGISDALNRLIYSFAQKFTSRIEDYSRKVRTLNIFSEDYTEKNQEIAREFITGLLRDLSKEIKTVSQADFGPVFSSLMDTIRESIISTASRTTSFIVREAASTAITLPGTLVGTVVSSTVESARNVFKGGPSGFLDTISSIGEKFSGIGSLVLMFGLRDEAHKVLTGQASWKDFILSPTFSKMTGFASATYLLGQQEGLSEFAGSFLLAQSLFGGSRATLGLSVGLTLLDEIRRQSHGITGGLAGALETGILFASIYSALRGLGGKALSSTLIKSVTESIASQGIRRTLISFAGEMGASLLARLGLTGGLAGILAPEVSIPLLLAGALTYGAYSFFKGREEEIKRENLEDILTRAESQLKNSIEATTRQLVAQIELLTGKKLQESDIEKVRTFARAHLFSQKFELEAQRTLGEYLIKAGLSERGIARFLEASSGIFEQVAEELSTKKNLTIEDVSKELRAKLEEAGLIKQLKGAGILDREIDLYLRGVSEKFIKDYGEYRSIRKQEAEFVKGLEPQIIKNELKEFVPEPVKVQEPKTLDDLVRFKEQALRALSDYFSIMSSLSSEIGLQARAFISGMMPADTYAKIVKGYYDFFAPLLSSESGLKMIAGNTRLYSTYMALFSEKGYADTIFAPVNMAASELMSSLRMGGIAYTGEGDSFWYRIYGKVIDLLDKYKVTPEMLAQSDRLLGLVLQLINPGFAARAGIPKDDYEHYKDFLQPLAEKAIDIKVEEAFKDLEKSLKASTKLYEKVKKPSEEISKKIAEYRFEQEKERLEPGKKLLEKVGLTEKPKEEPKKEPKEKPKEELSPEIEFSSEFTCCDTSECTCPNIKKMEEEDKKFDEEIERDIQETRRQFEPRATLSGLIGDGKGQYTAIFSLLDGKTIDVPISEETYKLLDTLLDKGAEISVPLSVIKSGKLEKFLGKNYKDNLDNTEEECIEPREEYSTREECLEPREEPKEKYSTREEPREKYPFKGIKRENEFSEKILGEVQESLNQFEELKATLSGIIEDRKGHPIAIFTSPGVGTIGIPISEKTHKLLDTLLDKGVKVSVPLPIVDKPSKLEKFLEENYIGYSDTSFSSFGKMVSAFKEAAKAHLLGILEKGNQYFADFELSNGAEFEIAVSKNAYRMLDSFLEAGKSLDIPLSVLKSGNLESYLAKLQNIRIQVPEQRAMIEKVEEHKEDREPKKDLDLSGVSVVNIYGS